MVSRRNLLKSSLAAPIALTALPSSAVTEAPAKWDGTYDVVIIGAGGGGLMGAHYAAELGLKALVLEKLGFVGGSSAVCGGALSVADSQYQRDHGIKDSDELFIEEMLKVGKYVNDPALVKAHVDSIKHVYDFICNTLGASPKGISAVSGMSVPRSHSFYPPSELIHTLDDYVEKKQNVPVFLKTPAKRLVWDKGRICGVKAEKDGKDVYYQATKGVLIASGGFQFNKALMEKYNPLMAKVTPAGGIGNTGDGLLMAQEYGADVLDTNYIKATFGYQMTKYPNSFHGYYVGGIVVNHEGKRFVDESISYKLLSDAALMQPDDFTLQLFDEPIRQDQAQKGKREAGIMTELGKGQDTEYCFVGQTLEEVAKKAGVNPEELVKTVTKYNEDVDKGKDSAFGRSSLTAGYGKMVKIEKPPFYLYPTVPRCIATYCGIKIDVHARVIDVFGEVIPGMYACGEATGGVHGAAYMTGTAIGKAFSFGRLAAYDMAGKQA